MPPGVFVLDVLSHVSYGGSMKRTIVLALIALVCISGCKRKQHEAASVEITPVQSADASFTQSRADVLREAAKTGDTGAIEFLIKSGASLDLPDGASVLLYAMKNGRDDTAVFLIDNNAKIDVRDDRGGKPLHYAALFGLPKAAERLIGRRADVNARDDTGMPPIAYAIYAKHPGIVGLLLTAGASADGQLRGKTYADYARAAGAVDIAEKIAAKLVFEGRSSREIAPEYLARALLYADTFLSNYETQLAAKRCAFQAKQFSTAADFVRRARASAETNYNAIAELERYAVDATAAMPPCVATP